MYLCQSIITVADVQAVCFVVQNVEAWHAAQGDCGKRCRTFSRSCRRIVQMRIMFVECDYVL